MSMRRQARGGLARHNRYVRYVHTQSHPPGFSLSSPTVIYPRTNDAADSGRRDLSCNADPPSFVALGPLPDDDLSDGAEEVGSGVLGCGVGAGVAVDDESLGGGEKP